MGWHIPYFQVFQRIFSRQKSIDRVEEVMNENKATYQDIRRQVENLTPEEQFCLLEELAIIVRRRIPLKPKRSIMELEGVGKETWRGVDAQEYVNQERTSWNG